MHRYTEGHGVAWTFLGKRDHEWQSFKSLGVSLQVASSAGPSMVKPLGLSQALGAAAAHSIPRVGRVWAGCVAVKYSFKGVYTDATDSSGREPSVGGQLRGSAGTEGLARRGCPGSGAHRKNSQEAIWFQAGWQVDISITMEFLKNHFLRTL